MKKLILLLSLFLFNSAIFAQDNALEVKSQELAETQVALEALKAKVDSLKTEVNALTPRKIWSKGGYTGVNFSSLGLTNWVAGGVSSNSITVFGNIFRNYKQRKIEWVNNLDVAYGFIQNDGAALRKNDDRIDLLSKAGYALAPKVNFSGLANFKSQFAPGFQFNDETISDNERVAISKFMSPATLVTSAGFDFKITKHLAIYVSPATGKFTFVMNDSIAAARTYIPDDKDDNGNYYYAEHFRPEFGAYLKATLKKDLTEKIYVKSTLDLFNNLTDANKKNRLNTDIDWITDFNMKLTKYLTAKVFANVKYDHNQVMPSDALLNKGPKAQFQRLIGLGFMYKF